MSPPARGCTRSVASLLRARSRLAPACAAPFLVIAIVIASCGGGGGGTGGSTATSAGRSVASAASGTGGGGFFVDAGADDGMADGCTPVDAGSVADASTGCEGLAPGVHFGADLGPILTQSCNGDSCHVVPTYGSLVGDGGIRAFECCDGRLLVAPGNAARSYLMDKITGHHLCSGGRMPLAQPPLSDADMLTIRRWICEGAPDD